MNPTEFLAALERLKSTLAQSKAKRVRALNERNHIQAVVAAWFGQYRPAFLALIAEEKPFLFIDDVMQKVVKLASEPSPRLTYKRLCGSVQRHFRDHLLVALSRAYWSRAPERVPPGRDPDVARRLRTFDAELAESYEQVVKDLADRDRRTYRGTAAELREVIRGVLGRLAPDDQVKNTEWYKEARRTGARTEANPTQSERTKFILRQRSAASAAEEAAESYMSSIEERLGHVVRAFYRRASDSAHAGAEREEVTQQLRYANALLAELLPPENVI